MGTTTGYHRRLGDMLLQRAGWLDKFQAKVGSDEVALGRPAPFMIFRAMEATRVTRVSEVITVGDTPLDLQAGANAGVRGIVGVFVAPTMRSVCNRSHTPTFCPASPSFPQSSQEYRVRSDHGGQ